MPSRRVALALGSLVFVLAPGCDCSGPMRVPDGGIGGEGGMMDSGRLDTGGPPPDGGVADAGPPSCLNDLECPAGLLCFGGFYQDDPCATASPCTGTDERCRAV